MILYMISYCEQDCVVVLAPFPNNQNPVESFNVKTDFDLQMAAKDSFEPFAVFSGNVSSTADGPRHVAIRSI